jgi:hypothetical protein
MPARNQTYRPARSSAIRDTTTANTSHADTNCSASGPHFPDLDWPTVPLAVRDYVGRLENGRWVRETGALDRLIGRWDATTGGRRDGSGFHHVAELIPLSVRPFAATSNIRDLHVDHAMINDEMRRVATVVPGSYQFHVPRGRARSEWPSDHRRISFKLHFTTSIPDTQTPVTPPASP